jgi:hypothetical protein
VGDIQRPEVAGDIFADLRVVQVLVIGEALLTCKISEHRLLMLMRPAIGFARFTVSSYMMYG